MAGIIKEPIPDVVAMSDPDIAKITHTPGYGAIF